MLSPEPHKIKIKITITITLAGSQGSLLGPGPASTKKTGSEAKPQGLSISAKLVIGHAMLTFPFPLPLFSLLWRRAHHSAHTSGIWSAWVDP
jgi:hypothetical protein